jgi:hypothetical protein
MGFIRVINKQKTYWPIPLVYGMPPWLTSRASKIVTVDYYEWQCRLEIADVVNNAHASSDAGSIFKAGVKKRLPQLNVDIIRPRDRENILKLRSIEES